MSEIENDGFVTIANDAESVQKANKYDRTIKDRQGNVAVVDVYDVLKAFNVTNPADQHAIKKMLCMGLRGHKDHKDAAQDRQEAIQSLQRGAQL